MRTPHCSRAIGSDRKRHGHSYEGLLIEPLEGRRLLSATIYVDASASGPVQDGSSWADAYADLQQALAAANVGDQIHVAGGTYKPTGGNDRSATFQLKSGVSIEGGYAGSGAANPDARDVVQYATILSGDIGVAGNKSDNSYTLVVADHVDNTVLDGFSITGAGGSFNLGGGGVRVVQGSVTLAHCTISDNLDPGGFNGAFGGGIVHFGGTLILNDCTISGNSASDGFNAYGGGIYNDGTLILSCCIVNGNVALGVESLGGGIYNAGMLVANDCTIGQNSAGPLAPYNDTYAAGGGIYNARETGTVNLYGCTVSDNSALATDNLSESVGGGLYSDNASSAALSDCSFNGNSAQYGGGLLHNTDSPLTINDCLFSGNLGTYSAGAIEDDGVGVLTLNNCTVSSNTSTEDGGGIVAWSVAVNNSILWGNAPPQSPQMLGFNTATVTHSDIQGGFSGPGNVDADPKFVRNPSPGPDGTWGTADDDYGDLRLQPDSPCIDAGDNTAVPAGVTTDLAGKSRFVDFPGVNDPGAIVDIGAYEHGPLASIAARQVFYNDSSYDGNDPGAGPADDAAIASDKSALLPGQTATAANFTSFFHGLNGVMIDVLNLADPAALSAADFSFKSGAGPDPASWSSAPAPASISVRSGAGADGSDRITLIWADGALQNTWLQVTVNPTAITGLAAPDDFYFGNLIGDANGNGQVTVADIALTKSLSGQLADITAPADFNRSGQISVADIAIAKASQGNAIAMLYAPAPSPAPTASFLQTPLAALRARSEVAAATASIPPAPSQPLLPRGHERRRIRHLRGLQLNRQERQHRLLEEVGGPFECWTT
jgi:hypothetical protein